MIGGLSRHSMKHESMIKSILLYSRKKKKKKKKKKATTKKKRKGDGEKH